MHWNGQHHLLRQQALNRSTHEQLRQDAPQVPAAAAAAAVARVSSNAHCNVQHHLLFEQVPLQALHDSPHEESLP
jgi:hypothetical protein